MPPRTSFASTVCLLQLLACGGEPATHQDGGEAAVTDTGSVAEEDARVDRDTAEPHDAGPPPARTGPAGWERLEGTAIRPHCPEVPEIHGVEGCSAVTEDWSGGAYDTRRDRLVITGGGHNGYYGNELYGLDVATATMARLTEPGLPPGPYDSCEEAIAGGSQPNSRHTYDGVEYVHGLDLLYVFSGSLACGVGSFGRVTWTYGFATAAWRRMEPTGELPSGEAGMMTAYDPVTGLVFIHDRAHLHTYDASTDVYTRVSGWAGLGYHHTATIDPVRRLFVIAGWSSGDEAGRVYLYDIGDLAGGSAEELRTLETVGGAEVIDAVYPGIAHDPVSGLIVGWAGGDTVYALDVDTALWTPMSYTGGPGDALQNGTMGRWQYAPALDAFVVVNDVDDDAYLFRMERGS